MQLTNKQFQNPKRLTHQTATTTTAAITTQQKYVRGRTGIVSLGRHLLRHLHIDQKFLHGILLYDMKLSLLGNIFLPKNIQYYDVRNGSGRLPSIIFFY
mmetsp:Transcript_29274/g.53692  ORF Transcript_29274/g.53692 Transcript_29274/m.53692 type:complete len:99 (-) Transcript_29274:745-1041(-)